MAPSLYSLPPELVEAIAQQITDGEKQKALLQLRLTCRSLEAATRRWFIKWYFTRRTVDLVSWKLQSLIALTKVPDLASAVTTLRIACEDDGHARLLLDTQAMRYTETAITAGPLLTLALQGLPNVKDFHFVERYPAKEAPGGASDQGHCNITSSFATALGAMHACGVKPIHLVMYADDPLNTRVGVHEEFGAFRFTELVSDLQTLQLHLLNIGPGRGRRGELGTRFGEQLALTIPHLTSLKELNLKFDDAYIVSKYDLHLIASCHTLPPLYFINLIGCSIEPPDLFKLLKGCCQTLKEFCCLDVMLQETTDTWLLQIFCLIQEQMALRYLKLDRMYTDTGSVEFPALASAFYWADEEEEDYIHVEAIQGVEFEDEDEVRRGVSQMRDCMVVVPWQ